MDFQRLAGNLFRLLFLENVGGDGHLAAFLVLDNQTGQAEGRGFGVPVIGLGSADGPACQLVAFLHNNFRHDKGVAAVCPGNGLSTACFVVQFPVGAFGVVNGPVDLQRLAGSFFLFLFFDDVGSDGHLAALFILHNQTGQAEGRGLRVPVVGLGAADRPACQLIAFLHNNFRHDKGIASVCPGNGLGIACFATIFPVSAFRIVNSPVDFQGLACIRVNRLKFCGVRDILLFRVGEFLPDRGLRILKGNKAAGRKNLTVPGIRPADKLHSLRCNDIGGILSIFRSAGNQRVGKHIIFRRASFRPSAFASVKTDNNTLFAAFVRGKRHGRDADAEHQHRQKRRQQTTKLFRFLHVITPLHTFLFQPPQPCPHVLCRPQRLKPGSDAAGVYAPCGQRAGSNGSGFTFTVSASVLSPSRKGRAITTMRASCIA